MSTEDIAQDQENKKSIVLEHLTKACNATAEFDDLQEIGKAIAAGDKLAAKPIAGGKTNYSYKVYLEGAPEKALFAKISFAFALWNPDRSVHYDLKRVESEFQIMAQFADMMDDAPVVTPYCLIDVNDGEMKIVVTQWSPGDEQFGNQFIDGSVDQRVLPKLGAAFATLNTAEYDKSFNAQVTECMSTLFPLQKESLVKFATDDIENPDKAIRYAKEVGGEKVEQIHDAFAESYLTADVLCHSDSHVFNILVEAKPSIDKLQEFGDNGSVVLCDWEMSCGGPKGKDIGIFQCFPVASAMAHAILGNKDCSTHILECIDIFLDSYFEEMRKKGKDDAYLAEAFRNSLGIAALYIFMGYYVMRIHMEYLPLDTVPEEDQAKMFGSIGYIGLKFYVIGFTDEYKDLSLEELRALHRELLVGEIEDLDASRSPRPRRGRRSSVLRATGRRVSDASVYDEAARRLSEMSKDGSQRRLSVYTDVVVAETLEEILEKK